MYHFVGRDFFPAIDGGQIQLHVRAPAGTASKRLSRSSRRSPVLPTRTSNRRPTRRPSSRRSTAPLGLNASQIATNLNVSLSSSEQVTPNFWTDPANGIPYYLAVQTPEPQIASLNSLTNTPVSTALSPQGDHELPAGRQDRVAHRDPQRACCVVGGIDEHLGRCRLLLQSLARLSDQPRVLHRDYRLRGEVLQQGDLLVGERPHLLTVDADRAEQRILLAQRHGDQRTHPLEQFVTLGDQRQRHRPQARHILRKHIGRRHRNPDSTTIRLALRLPSAPRFNLSRCCTARCWRSSSP